MTRPGPDHPSAETLVALAEDRLEACTADVQAHLEECVDCQEMLEDLRSFGDLGSPGEAWEVGAEELQSALESVREELDLSQAVPRRAAQRETESGGAEVRSIVQAAARFRSLRRTLPWAAVFLLGLGLGFWSTKSRSWPVGAYVVDMYSEDSRGALDCLPTERATLLVLLPLPEPGLYDALLRDAEGHETPLIRLRIESANPLIEIPKGFEPDTFELVLYDVERERDAAVREICFRQPGSTE